MSLFQPVGLSVLSVETSQLNLGQMYEAIVSTYIISKDQPLPTAEEVMLCCYNTTAEQVENFLRRAASFYAKGKVFCLANVDVMDFEVLKTVESAFDRQLRNVPG